MCLVLAIDNKRKLNENVHVSIVSIGKFEQMINDTINTIDSLTSDTIDRTEPSKTIDIGISV